MNENRLLGSLTPPPKSGHRHDLYPTIGENIPRQTLSNSGTIQEATNSAARDLARVTLYDPERTEAELSDTHTSPLKAIPKSAGWREDHFINTDIAKSNGLLATRILSDAFSYKCGYRTPEPPHEETLQRENTKAFPGHGTRGACAWSQKSRLKNEGNIDAPDLRLLLRMNAVARSIGRYDAGSADSERNGTCDDGGRDHGLSLHPGVQSRSG